MSRFDRRWLDRREAADARSRCRSIAAAALRWRAGRERIAVVDLGAGTGANPRYLAARLGGSQRWRLLDFDSELLEGVRERMGRWARREGIAVRAAGPLIRVRDERLTCDFRSVRIDFAPGFGSLGFRGVDLVTASALLDLVSRRWLEALVGRCARSGSAVLLALSYDGRIRFAPPHPEDARVRAAVNRHQRLDKGFGPALGPAAAATARRLLAAAGYRVSTGDSAWRLEASDRALQAALIDGWARAASALADERPHHSAIEGWRRERAAWVAAGRSRIEVGHTDLFASLPGACHRAPRRSSSKSTSSPIVK